MGFIQMFTNYLNAVVGRNQEFEELIKAKDISRVKELFTTREALTAEAMKEYDPKQHEIMSRQDKILKNPKGERKGTLKRWKLPINYPQYINEIALVFIYGRPIKWTNQSEGTDKAFSAFQDLIKRTRFDSKVRQCKRLGLKRRLQCYSECSVTMRTNPTAKFECWQRVRGTKSMLVGICTRTLFLLRGATT